MEDALAALRLQIEWGADEALDAEPADRLARRDTPAAPPPAPARPRDPRPVPAAAAHSPSALTPAALAEHAAQGAATIAELRDAWAAFEGCALRDTATSLVFGEGEPGATLALVGDVPGEAEDLSGRPFAGAPGALLDRMLASIGLAREGLAIAMLVPWRPPGGRPPSAAEIACCAPFLLHHLGLLKPRLVLTLGSAPAGVLAGGAARLRRLRGQWQEIALPGAPPARFLATHAPAALLAHPPLKRDAWADLLRLREALAELGRVHDPASEKSFHQIPPASV